jgi:hypothetical protein
MLIIEIQLNEKIKLNPDGYIIILEYLNKQTKRALENDFDLVIDSISFDYDSNNYLVEFSFITFLEDYQKEQLVKFLLSENKVFNFIITNFNLIFINLINSLQQIKVKLK